MQPNKEYMEYLSKRLEALNPHLTPESIKQAKTGDRIDPIDWMGQAGFNYLKNKKDPDINPDPLFPDRNFKN